MEEEEEEEEEEEKKKKKKDMHEKEIAFDDVTKIMN